MIHHSFENVLSTTLYEKENYAILFIILSKYDRRLTLFLTFYDNKKLKDIRSFEIYDIFSNNFI